MTILIYTVGPRSLGRHEDLLARGADGVRLTFSFGTPDLQRERAELVKEAGRRLARPVHVMADLAGEKYRLAAFPEAPSVPVRGGEILGLHVAGSAPRGDGVSPDLPVAGRELFGQAHPGDTLTVGDGEVVLVVQEVCPTTLTAAATADGVVDQCRGLTICGTEFRPRPLTSKDLADLDVVLASEAFDSVALSFVASPDDVAEVKGRVRRAGRELLIAAKIETAAGLDHLDAIASEADVLIAARGDLALAIDWVELPEAVERIIAAARSRGKPWWLATQLLSGLDHHAMPTRAEICDAAYWIRTGCSGLVLCRETAFGPRPEVAVACARRLIDRWGHRSTKRDEVAMRAGRSDLSETLSVLPEGPVS